MTTRFCPGCQAEVADTGGFCLLGHRLTLSAPVASLSALREEVDASFDEAELSDVDFEAGNDPSWDRVVEPAMAGVVTTPPAAPRAPVRRVVPPPPPPIHSAPTASVSAPAAPAAPSVPAPARRVPPPPPPAGNEGFVRPSALPVAPPPPPPPPIVDRTFAAAIPPAPSIQPNPASPAMARDDLAGDPIAAFAPAPRMDWGPDKGRLNRLKRRSRRDEDAE